MTIAFLFVSPMVNEAAVLVLLGVLGWKVTALYVAGGSMVGSAAGFVLTRLGFDRYIGEFDIGSRTYCEGRASSREPARRAYGEARDIVKQVIAYVILGVGIGALVHGYVPQRVVTDYLTGPLAEPGAVLVGISIYPNVMGVIPVVESLVGKGVPIGTSLAFMMSVAALSFPEFVHLKKGMKKELIAAYAAVLGTGIAPMGLTLNLLL